MTRKRRLTTELSAQGAGRFADQIELHFAQELRTLPVLKSLRKALGPGRAEQLIQRAFMCLAFAQAASASTPLIQRLKADRARHILDLAVKESNRAKSFRTTVPRWQYLVVGGGVLDERSAQSLEDVVVAVLVSCNERLEAMLAPV